MTILRTIIPAEREDALAKLWPILARHEKHRQGLPANRTGAGSVALAEANRRGNARKIAAAKARAMAVAHLLPHEAAQELGMTVEAVRHARKRYGIEGPKRPRGRQPQ